MLRSYVVAYLLFLFLPIAMITLFFVPCELGAEFPI